MTSEHEEWREIASLPGYEASSLGRIRHDDKILPGTAHGKYRRVCLRSKGSPRKNLLVHRLVCEAFHGPAPVGLDCAHRDGDCSNNRPSNLRWATHRENLRDKWKHQAHAHGVKMSRVVKSDAVAIEIYQRGRAGESASSLAAEFGYSEFTVIRIFDGRAWSRVTGARRTRSRNRKPPGPVQMFERWHLDTLAAKRVYLPSVADIPAALGRRQRAVADLIGRSKWG